MPKVDRTDPPGLARSANAHVPDIRNLVDAHSDSLYRFAHSLCPQAGTAENLVCQTFLEWMNQGSSSCAFGRVKTWLFTALYRRWLANREHEQTQPVPGLPFDSVNEHEPEASLNSTTLHRQLLTLDESYRAPLVLFYLAEFSYVEIAGVLDLPIHVLTSRLSRAKEELGSLCQRAQGQPH